MRWMTFFLLVCFLAACQREPVANEPVDGQARPIGAGDVEEQEFVDNVGLQNGRFLLISHMTQKENLAVPAADAWEPDGTYVDGEWQVYRFKSGEWQLTIAGMQGEADPTMYRTRLSGPDGFDYAADIFADGTVAPNQ